mmetsp:Transcript_92894/g.160961  ORF Transcript_92894/g.160961 Transcript_92894/m.160961 type:complete len:205 (+) Transcript_92894:181-795(+)
MQQDMAVLGGVRMDSRFQGKSVPNPASSFAQGQCGSPNVVGHVVQEPPKTLPWPMSHRLRRSGCSRCWGTPGPRTGTLEWARPGPSRPAPLAGWSATGGGSPQPLKPDRGRTPASRAPSMSRLAGVHSAPNRQPEGQQPSRNARNGPGQEIGRRWGDGGWGSRVPRALRMLGIPLGAGFRSGPGLSARCPIFGRRPRTSWGSCG